MYIFDILSSGLLMFSLSVNKGAKSTKIKFFTSFCVHFVQISLSLVYFQQVVCEETNRLEEILSSLPDCYKYNDSFNYKQYDSTAPNVLPPYPEASVLFPELWILYYKTESSYDATHFLLLTVFSRGFFLFHHRFCGRFCLIQEDSMLFAPPYIPVFYLLSQVPTPHF